MRTSSPSRWTCTRAPSSFHSTDAGPVWPSASVTSAALAASIGWIGCSTASRTASRAVATLGEREHGGAAEVAREHRGAADDVDRDPGRGGDGVGHHPGQRALAELAGEQPADEVDLGLGGAGEEVGEQRLAGRLRPGTRGAGQLGEDPVDLEDLDRGLGGGLDVLPVGRSPADADATLARRAGEEPDRHLDLVGIERAQELGERSHLRLPRARGPHRGGRGDQRGEQHATHAAKSVHDSPACERWRAQTS